MVCIIFMLPRMIPEQETARVTERHTDRQRDRRTETENIMWKLIQGQRRRRIDKVSPKWGWVAVEGGGGVEEASCQMPDASLRRER